MGDSEGNECAARRDRGLGGAWSGWCIYVCYKESPCCGTRLVAAAPVTTDVPLPKFVTKFAERQGRHRWGSNCSCSVCTGKVHIPRHIPGRPSPFLPTRGPTTNLGTVYQRAHQLCRYLPRLTFGLISTDSTSVTGHATEGNLGTLERCTRTRTRVSITGGPTMSMYHPNHLTRASLERQRRQGRTHPRNTAYIPMYLVPSYRKGYRIPTWPPGLLSTASQPWTSSLLLLLLLLLVALGLCPVCPTMGPVNDPFFTCAVRGCYLHIAVLLQWLVLLLPTY